MPKAWSEEEKEKIRGALLDQGRRLFEQFGLQKTTIDDIVQAARISKGAFYQFYTSKEELYFATLESMEDELRSKVYGNLAHPGPSRRESFKCFLRDSIELLMTMPLYRQIASADLQLLLRRLPADSLEQHFREDEEYLAGYLEEWMDRGWMRRVDARAVGGLIRSLVYFVLHRDDMGREDFETTTDLLVEMIAEYLVPEG